MLAAGISPDAIKHRIRCGRLIPEYDGVYAVGFRAADQLSKWQAALLAVGDDGVLSHLAAAAAHRFGPDPMIIDITCPRRLQSRRGIRLHHRALPPEAVTRLGSLPLTSPAQTIFDLATLLKPERLAKAANEAFVLQLVTTDGLHDTLIRNANRRGATAFRNLLATLDPEGRRVRSDLEVRLHAFLRARGFPPWESNVPLRIGNDLIEPDVLWRRQRVIVEADGRDPHLAPLTFDSDRRKDRRLAAEGWQAVRVTSRDLGPGADELEADLWAILGDEPPE